MRFAKLPDDEPLLLLARTRAGAILEDDPALLKANHRALRERVLTRYPRAVEFFRTG